VPKDETSGTSASARLIHVTIDENSIGRTTPEVDHERQVAIFDLLERNSFELTGGTPGPYRLDLSMAEQRLVLSIAREDDTQPCAVFMLSLSPFRRVVKDYFLVCDSYFDAIKTAPPSRIEALDMGRRALHDEGSKLLMERLDGKVRLDFETARRLFTLLCALHWKG
jgi:uncharacterized protein (UPF0262 family)